MKKLFTVLLLTFISIMTSVNAYDITNIEYNDIFNIFSNDSEGAVFNNDGTKIIFTDPDNDRFVIWDLNGAAYDITNNNLNSFVDYSSISSRLRIPVFNDDGTKLFAYNADNGLIVELNLSTAYDVSTFSLSSNTFNPGEFIQSLRFNNDGSKMYWFSFAGIVNEFNLSTNFDISTAVSNNSFTFNENYSFLRQALFSNDGSYLIVSNSGDNKLYQYSLSTNFDVSTISYDNYNYDYGSEFNASPETLLSNNDGSKIFLGGGAFSGTRIYQYDNQVEPPEYNVELQTNTPYNDFIYQDDEVNVTTDSVITTILNDESFTVTSTAQSTGSYTFNYWYDLDNMVIFTTDRNFTIVDPNQDYNLIADYTLDSFNTFNINSNLPTAQDFTFNTFTLENEVYSFNQTEFDNYQHPSDRAWEIIAPITNIGFYEFDYYYDNDGNDIYDFNHIITGSGFSPPNLTAVYSLPEEYQINLIIESNIGNIIFQHEENDPISGPFISQTIGLGDNWTATAPNNADYQFNVWINLEDTMPFSNNQTLDINNTDKNYYLEAFYLDLVDINWDSAGGTPIAEQTVVINSSVQPPTEPIRPGFVFDYWEDSDNNEVSFPQTITEDVTFTAIWLETFTVDFQVNGGAPVPSQTVLENDTINVVTPSRFGFTFEGWYTDNVTFNNQFNFNNPIDQDDTIFAKWAFGTEDNAEQSLNVFLVDSNLDDPFAQIIIVLAFFVLLNAIIYVYSGPMIVTLILNFILTALFMVLGFIPFWIIIMIFIAIFGFALLMLFGGRSTA